MFDVKFCKMFKGWQKGFHRKITELLEKFPESKAIQNEFLLKCG